MSTRTQAWHLRAGGTSLIVDTIGQFCPRVSYWGPEVGDDPAVVEAVLESQGLSVPSGTCDIPLRVGVLPEESAGWLGEPGIMLTRGGRLIPVKLHTTRVESGGADDSPWPLDGPEGQQVGAWLWADVTDATAKIEGRIEIQVTPSGIVRQRAHIRNSGDEPLGVARLVPTLPLPTTLTQIVDQAGRHLRERQTQMHEATIGVHHRPTRGARNHNASTILGAAVAGANARQGRVAYGHVEWSGNVDQWVERTPFGHLVLAGGELLMPGEIELARGETYSSPWLSATWGDGFDAASAKFHSYVRGFTAHPSRPRPVTLNAWEAVYFAQTFEGLSELARLAAEVGVERFVLDDGWFGSRRDDRSGLGDWQVSEDVWPDGLQPLARMVHDLGMEFGLWFEPEMLNMDSEIARAHPEWIMGPRDREPLESRHQQVLNLTAPGVVDYLEDAISRLVSEVGIDYIKWDYNRDLLEAYDRIGGGYAVHGQTVALYALLDRLHERFPDLEIESCAGGGGRVDLGIMRRAQRIWGSDCIDPLERQIIQAGTSLLLPAELIGSHIASPTSHTTGRTQNLQFRCLNAQFYHLGIEWDLRRASEVERAELAAWVAAHKNIRDVSHTGSLVTGLQPDDATRVVGAVAEDGAQAYYVVIQTRTSASRPAGILTLPGLDPDGMYRIEAPIIANNAVVGLPPDHGGHGSTLAGAPAWWASGVIASGAFLAEVGVAGPIVNPERAVLLRATRL
ncbi:alpha-galactosidase [Nanchangia anserum]|uniref:alpha-galactosidase n=1 Tax=Nanchangia anserum TaxID=2692125 RepID=UPI001D11308D|nr:alpha-galactosidase [Nanchangia anserum]